MERLCVYAGSRSGAHPSYVQAAVDLGALLAARGIGLVYGGASVGLMGAIADAVVAAGGEAIGVIPRALLEREIGHEGLTELRIVASMHERKALMSELSDAALALPGGLGTFEEILEAATWSQLGIHANPCALLNVRGYYDALAALLDRAVDDSFLSSEDRGIVLLDDDPERLLEQLIARTGHRRGATPEADRPSS